MRAIKDLLLAELNVMRAQRDAYRKGTPATLADSDSDELGLTVSSAEIFGRQEALTNALDVLDGAAGAPEGDAIKAMAFYLRHLFNYLNKTSTRSDDWVGGTWILAKEESRRDEMRKVIDRILAVIAGAK
jgi:hypothetical protein